MRVLQIVGGYKPKGTRDNIFVHRQIASLKAQIKDMKIIYAGLGSRPWDMMLFVKKLRQEIKSFQPDVVHSQYATVTGALTIALSGSIPTVVSFGGDEIYGTYSNEYSTKSLRTKLALSFSKYCAKKAAGCVAKNSHMAQVLNSWSAKCVHVLPNGVDLKLFKELDQTKCRNRLHLKNDIRYVCFAIRDQDYVKRFDLAKLAVDLCNKNGSRSTELLVLDKVAPEKIPLYLNASDVLLLCSNHEGSPNIVKESLACNRPVVSTDVGDVRERFQSVDGLFIVRQNPECIAEGLMKAMQYDKSDGRRYIEDIAENKIAKKLIHIYEDLCGSMQKPTI